MTDLPARPYLYHITHVDNLPSILTKRRFVVGRGDH